MAVRHKTDFSKMSLANFSSVVKGMSATNAEKTNEAIRKVDSWTFQLTHPEIIFNDNTVKMIDHWLKTRNITFPTYEDFGNATDFLISTNSIDLDQAELAKKADGDRQRTFTGPVSGRKYDSAETMIVQERHEALNKLPAPSQEEIDLEAMPFEEFQEAMKFAERQEHLLTHRAEVQNTCDAYMLTRPEIVDSERNARLINMQLRSNGVAEGTETVEQLDRATNQLRESGLLTLNKAQLDKQRSAEVTRIAREAIAMPGGPFDRKTEADIEADNLPLEELRKRANHQLASR